MAADISESQKQHLAHVQHSRTSVALPQSSITEQQQQYPRSSSQNQQQPQQTQMLSEFGAHMALSVRLLMQGKEVGSIIGKKGDNIKKFREISGAKIIVSDSSCPDRIVTLTGSLDEVHNAITMICTKFEEQIVQAGPNSAGLNMTSNSPPIQSTNQGNNMILGASASNVMDPLFGLPASGILGDALNDGNLVAKNEGEMLTMNNNSTSAINNNLGASTNNLTSSVGVKSIGSANGSDLAAGLAPLITLRLIVPASQCGSLIGKGGARIKEIREMTGATIQVAQDVLPNSTERVVTISGARDSLKSCAYMICSIMVESPPKGYTIPYRPKPALNTMLLAAAASASASQAAAAYNIPGHIPPHLALSTHPELNRLFSNNPIAVASLRAAAATGQAAALSAVASQPIGSHEMVIPNALIGCVIGKGGSKINEIRQLSGATIKISNSDEGTKNRTITINGSTEAINMAQYLITASCSGQQTSLIDNIAKPSASNKSARKFAPY